MLLLQRKSATPPPSSIGWHSASTHARNRAAISTRMNLRKTPPTAARWRSDAGVRQMHDDDLAHLEGEVASLRTKLADTATFLDRLAQDILAWPYMSPEVRKAAADCRAKARELRGDE